MIASNMVGWGTLPADMTPTLEWAARELWARPIRFPGYTLYEYRVFPMQTQTNLVAGVVRRMQRVVLLAIKAGRRAFSFPFFPPRPDPSTPSTFTAGTVGASSTCCAG